MPLQATSGAASYDAFGGGVPVSINYIEEVFSTWLYTGNGSTRTITNGIDLAGKGGLVWLKSRSQGTQHILEDTARGIGSGTGRVLDTSTASPAGDDTYQPIFSSVNNNGFTLGIGGGYAASNVNSQTYVSWTFREQAKFFDVVTWTGNGANRTIAHNLGSVPGCIMVKRTDTTGDWQVYHRSLANTEYLVLNSTAAKATGATRWNSTTPTSTVFSLGTDATVNASGGTYVAYVFAHDAGGFGLTGTDNVISCGSFNPTSNGSVDLGYEPQWIIAKKATGTGGAWFMWDSMRGWPAGRTVTGQVLRANGNNAEAETSGIAPTATGFDYAALGDTWIYIAIRRGPMQVPTTGTSVFALSTWTGSTGAKSWGTQTANFGTGYAAFIKSRTSGQSWGQFDQLRGWQPYLDSDLISAEFTDPGGISVVNNQLQLNSGSFYGAGGDGAGQNYIAQIFRRAPSFMDVVCYTGTGANRTVAHNLAAVPELLIVKVRSLTGAWQVYSSALANTEYVVLNTTAAKATGATRWNSTTPTSTVFSLGTASEVNTSAATYVAYLFATCPGVSKVGSYTGTGATQVINCGFTGGARFVLIKATSTTGNWLVWDSARGIVAGNDPYLLLNSAAAEVTTTDWVDTAATGFELSNAGGNLANSNGVSYIFLAIS
jgi:hypothetical protein